MRPSAENAAASGVRASRSAAAEAAAAAASWRAREVVRAARAKGYVGSSSVGPADADMA